MRVVSTAYEESGRAAQKSRTRAALVDAARGLVTEGQVPTVDSVAERAGISRTTAYRYFPNQRVLLRAAHPETGATSMLGEDPPDDVADRVDRVVAAFTQVILETEQQQRTMLRLSLEPTPGELPLRQGRAIGWIREAVTPLEGTVPDAELHRLVLAIHSVCGIEALVWLTDVAGLDAESAAGLMRWSAASLVRSALDGHLPTAGSSAPGRSRARRVAARQGPRP